MELTWINKLRIAAITAMGVVVIGMMAWPLAVPHDPLMPVRAWSINPFGTITLLALAFWIGFAGYFIAWPHGREIAILAVPFGLIVWAGRSGPMRMLYQATPEPVQREAVVHSLRFEPIYWLVIVAAGFIGVLVAQRLRPGAQPVVTFAQFRANLKRGNYLNLGIGVVVSTLLVAFLTGVFAQDLPTSYEIIAAQPAVGQIIFALLAAFGIAAFIIKKFLDLSYVWPTVASVFVLPLGDLIYGNTATIEKFALTKPATFYPHALFAILPVQLVALGALGSIIGYWMAIRYDYWRKHESAE